jgi:general secretion pathway protein G
MLRSLLPRRRRRLPVPRRAPARPGPTPPGPTPNGFSLLELMVVLVILGLLATVVVINVLPAQDRAMREKATADIAVLEQAVDAFTIDNMTPPSSADGLNALVTPPATLVRPDRYRPGGYIRRLPDDPWGNPYQYRQPGEHGPYDIFSFGADGRPGGEGNDADIGNWS